MGQPIELVALPRSPPVQPTVRREFKPAYWGLFMVGGWDVEGMLYPALPHRQQPTGEQSTHIPSQSHLGSTRQQDNKAVSSSWDWHQTTLGPIHAHTVAKHGKDIQAVCKFPLNSSRKILNRNSQSCPRVKHVYFTTKSLFCPTWKHFSWHMISLDCISMETGKELKAEDG